MTDPIQTGVVVNPAAGGQPGSEASGAVGGQPEGDKREISVPLHVVQAVRKELSEAKAGKATLEGRLSQLEAMQQMGGGFRPPPGQIQPAAPAETDPFKAAELEDDDLIDAKTLRKIVTTLRPSSSDEPLRTEVVKLQLHAMDPHYEDTIRTYLPEMITVNPMLREFITRSPNPLAAALTMARMSPKYIQAQQAGPGASPTPAPDPLAELQRIIENATRPGAPGSMGGGGGSMSGKDWARASDAEIDAEVARIVSTGAR